MTAKWTKVGDVRRKGDGLELVVNGEMFAVRAEDAPALIVQGDECDIYSIPLLPSGEPFVVGRAAWSGTGRMLCFSLPGKAGLVYVAGAHICQHYLREDRRAVEIVSPPVPEQERRVPTTTGAAVRAV